MLKKQVELPSINPLMRYLINLLFLGHNL